MGFQATCGWPVEKGWTVVFVMFQLALAELCFLELNFLYVSD